LRDYLDNKIDPRQANSYYDYDSLIAK